VSATERLSVRPFCFKCYDRTIGVACDVKELNRELRRLAVQDRDAVEYHLREGHIVRWLYSIQEGELAEELEGVRSIEKAQNRIEKYLEKSMVIYRMHHGRMH
jgi:hypothetical protein